MLIIVISIVAVLAFIVVLCFIYAENIKGFFSKKKKPKQEEQAKQTPKPEIKPEDFIPLKNQYDDQTRDASLEALFAEDENYNEVSPASDLLVENQPAEQKSSSITNMGGFEDLFLHNIKKSKKSNKPISEQIKELSPELKALLIDTTLKKRDDV